MTVLKAKLRSLDLAWKQDPLPILQGPRQNENSGFLVPTVRVSTQDGRAFNHTQGPERLPTGIPKMPTLCVSVENALQVFEENAGLLWFTRKTSCRYLLGAWGQEVAEGYLLGNHWTCPSAVRRAQKLVVGGMGRRGTCDELAGVTVYSGQVREQPRPLVMTPRLALGPGESWNHGEKEEAWEKSWYPHEG